MTANTFLKEFRHLADAPDGIKKLRELILQLAVRGKLVPQDPTDEPAGKLLKKITAEKARLVKEGKIKPQKPLPPISKDEMPYKLPDGWEWVRLGKIVEYGTSKKVPSSNIPNSAWLLDLEDIEKDTGRLLRKGDASKKMSKSTKTHFLEGDVLYGKLRPYLNKVVIADAEGYCTTEIIPLRQYCQKNPEYLKTVLMSPDFLNYVNALTYGVKMPRLGTDDGRKARVPLPPLAEQHRIVAKVDQLMKLCDELEEKQQEREKTRLAMNKSCLNALTSPDPCSSRPQPPTPPPQDVSAPTTRRTRPPEWAKHFRRISNNFHLLYDTPETVAELCKSILQLAVMGRLVPQDPRDEPAGKLLKKIAAEKARLVKEGKIKPQKPLPPISKDDAPYELPDGWEWVRLAVITEVNPRNDVEDGLTAGFAPMASVSDKYGVCPLFEERPWSEIKKGFTHFAEGDIVSAKITPCFQNGKSGVIENAPNGVGAGTTELHVVRPMSRTMVPHYIWAFFRSPRFLREGETKMTGSAGQKRVPRTYISETPFPLPPLAEQKRIVAKVDQLMKLCDELEAKLKQSRTDANSLIAAIVNHLTEAA